MKLREKVARLIYRAESDKRDGSRVTDDEADDDWRTLDEGTRELYFRTADAILALVAEDRRELVKALDRLHDYYLSLGEERVDPRMVASRISALVRDPANARYGAALAKEGVVL